MISKRSLLIITLLLHPYATLANELRPIELSWQKLNNAVRYQIEISADPDFKSPLKTDSTPVNSIKVHLKPGLYYYHVRGIDRLDRPGNWGQVDRLSVNASRPSSPKPVPGPTLFPNIEKEASTDRTAGKIRRLKLRYELEEANKANEVEPSVVVFGTCPTDWSLIVGSQTVSRDETESFQITLPLSGKVTYFQFVAISPAGEIEREVLEVKYPRWNGVRRNPKRFSGSVGLSPTLISYQQTRLPSFSQLALTAKGSFSYAIAPNRWEAGISGFATLASVPLTNSNRTASFIGVNLRIGYSIPGISAPWKFILFGGPYFTTMLNDGSFGFSNQIGPQFLPTVRRSLANGTLASAYVKFSPVTSQFKILSLSNREVALGGAWTWQMRRKRSVSITFDVSNLRLSNELSVIRVNTFSLGVSYGF